MLKARKLLTATAVSLALMSSASHALTLGDIEMRSALNQPMSAQIRLQTSNPSEVDGLIVTLASPEAFSRAGLERNATLNDLKFSVDTSIPTAPVINISSRTPVLEPFLNFLLEVDWPQGRMVREYTVLLDPPVFLSPSDSQRASISEGDVQRATDLSGVPVAIDRTSGAEFLGSDSFDESSVTVIGDVAEVGDEVFLDSGSTGFAGGAVEIVDFEGSQSVPTSFDAETIVIDGSAGSYQPLPSDGEIVVLDATGGSGEYIDGQDNFATAVEIVDGGVVSLTDSSVVDFSSASFNTESIDGFSVEVIGDNREVGNEVGSTGSFDSGVVASGEVVVRQGDTLFEIANRSKSSGITTQQMMIALLEANQQAFINGNMNLVKAGAVLNIPDSGAASVVSQAQALSEVAAQEQLWREYRRGARSTSSTRVAATDRAAPTTPSSSSSSAPSNTAATNTAATNTAAIDTATNDSDAGGTDSEQPLSAQEILEQARRELEQARGELRLVGENEASETATSTSADETDQPDTENLSDINRKLQLAREELEASRLKTEELQSRDDALQGTTERMDSLVNLRQNEVAKLEQQLSDARRSSTDSDAAGEDSSLAQVELIEEQADAVGVADTAETTVNQATTNTSEAASSSTRIIQPVETGSEGPWWKTILGDNKMLLAGGVGLLALLGLLFTIFRKRKPRDQFDAFDEEDVEFMDDDFEGNALVDTNADEYLDEGGLEQPLPESSPEYGTAAAAAGGTAAAAAAGVAMATGADASDDNLDGQFDEASLDEIGAGDGSLDDVFESATNGSSGLTEEMGGDVLDDRPEVSADDTMSEADVYIAYGLHGQAEDLLQKAISENPQQSEYHFKLMQTYHSQNNAAAFDAAAETYHNQFGAEASPYWSEVASMGGELSPSNVLYKGSAGSVESVGRGDLNAPKLSDNDFLTDGEGASSTVRDFSAENFSDDQSDLMDQTLDPGAAFAESDLEATGDFTQIAEEIREGSTDTLTFPAGADASGGSSLTDDLGGFLGGVKDKGGDVAGKLGGGLGGAASNLGEKASGLGDKTSLAVGGAATGLAGVAGGAAAMVGLGKSDDAKAAGNGSIEFDTSIEPTALDIDAQLPGAAPLPGGASPVADDLTLDLDQLSGDLEMDSKDLSQNSGLEMPDLNAADLTADDSLSLGNADEMDTMMDLAKAYIDMGDNDSASSALGEIVKSGNPEQRTEAQTLLRKIS